MLKLSVLLCALHGTQAFLDRFSSTLQDSDVWEVGGPTLHGWRDASVRVQRAHVEDFELFPSSYYGMGQYLMRDVQPERIETIFESNRFLREIEPVLRARMRVALSDNWETKIVSKSRRIDGFKSLALAFIEANKLGIKTTLSGSGVVGPDGQVQWPKVSFAVNFGNVPGLQGWATPQEAAKALKKAQIADDVMVLLSGMRNALIDVYQRRLDQPPSRGSRVPSMHRQFLTATNTQQAGILQLRRDLVCFQSEAQYIAKSDDYRNASRIANFIIPAVIGRVHFLSPEASQNQATFDAKRFEHPLRASSRWHFMHYESVGLLQMGVDTLGAAEEDQSLFTPFRGHLSEEEKLARTSLHKLVADRVAAAPDFVCQQAPVLTRNGYKDHCVHLGSHHHTLPEALSADEMFALKCAGLFPLQTSVVSLKLIQLPGKRNAVKERWVGRICTSQGWTEEIPLTDRRGEAAHRLCRRNAEQHVPAKDMLGILTQATPNRHRRKRATAK